MDASWTLILSDSDNTHVTIIKNMLEAEGISTRFIDHSDSAFPSTAESELYVQNEDAERAQTIIEEFKQSK
ncbi:MAG: putative signal transducing protein [Bacteroidia bacterium]|jgi:hypothetical protein